MPRSVDNADFERSDFEYVSVFERYIRRILGWQPQFTGRFLPHLRMEKKSVFVFMHAHWNFENIFQLRVSQHMIGMTMGVQNVFDPKAFCLN